MSNIRNRFKNQKLWNWTENRKFTNALIFGGNLTDISATVRSKSIIGLLLKLLPAQPTKLIPGEVIILWKVEPTSFPVLHPNLQVPTMLTNPKPLTPTPKPNPLMNLDKRQHFYNKEQIEVKWCIMELDLWVLPIHLMSQNNESNKQCFTILLFIISTYPLRQMFLYCINMQLVKFRTMTPIFEILD